MTHINRRTFLKQSAFVMTTVGLTLAGCGTTNGQRTSNKVVIWSPGDNGNIKDWSTDPILQAVEQATNTQIEFVRIGWDTYYTKVNAAVASHSIPDIIACYDFTAARTISQWVNDGVIAPFDGQIATIAPNIVKAYSQDTTLAEAKINGKIYAQPVYWNHGVGPTFPPVMVRKDILDKLGMTDPNTFDEFFAYVSAAKGLGYKGVIFGGKLSPSDIFNSFLNVFIGAYGLPAQGWLKQGSGYGYWAVQPQIKDAVMLFRKMLKAGVVEDSSWENDSQHSEELFDTGQYSAFFGGGGGHTGRIQNALDTQNKGYRAWVLPALDAGQGARGYTAGPTFYNYTFLGNLSNNNPTAAARVLNYLNSDEGLKLTAIGVAGRDYTQDSSGKITLLDARTQDNFPAIALGDTGAHPLATELVSWVPQSWQDFALEYGRDQSFTDWYNQMTAQQDKYLITGYGTTTTTPKWTDFSATNNELLSQTFLQLVRTGSDSDASAQFDAFVKQWQSQGGTDAAKEMSDRLVTIYH